MSIYVYIYVCMYVRTESLAVCCWLLGVVDVGVQVNGSDAFLSSARLVPSASLPFSVSRVQKGRQKTDKEETERRGDEEEKYQEEEKQPEPESEPKPEPEPEPRLPISHCTQAVLIAYTYTNTA
jgi:hypothetical protein